MLGIDLGERAKVTVMGVEFTLGLIPWGKFEELRLQLDRAYQPLAAPTAAKEAAPLDPAARAAWDAAIEAQSPAISATYREFVRWGLKGWRLGKVALEFDEVEFAGLRYQVVKHELVDFLAHVAHGKACTELGLAILKANALDEETLLSFR